MTYKKVKRKIQKLYDDEIKNIIIKYKGSYIIHGVYKVTNYNGLWEVQRYGQRIHLFDTSSTAISWCLADRTHQIMLAQNLIYADRRLQNKKNDVVVRKSYLINEKNIDRRATALTRITNDLYICKSIRNEILNSILSTKYIQIKGFIEL